MEEKRSGRGLAPSTRCGKEADLLPCRIPSACPLSLNSGDHLFFSSDIILHAQLRLDASPQAGLVFRKGEDQDKSPSHVHHHLWPQAQRVLLQGAAHRYHRRPLRMKGCQVSIKVGLNIEGGTRSSRWFCYERPTRRPRCSIDNYFVSFPMSLNNKYSFT